MEMEIALGMGGASILAMIVDLHAPHSTVTACAMGICEKGLLNLTKLLVAMKETKRLGRRLRTSYHPLHMQPKTMRIRMIRTNMPTRG